MLKKILGAALALATVLTAGNAYAQALEKKKLTFVTPYVGAGAVRTQSKASVANLQEETISKSRVFIGVNANFLLANIAFEAEKLGDNTSLSAKLGFRF